MYPTCYSREIGNDNPMIIHILNRQSVRRPNTKKIKSVLNFFLNKAAPDSTNTRWKEVSLLLTDDAGTRKIKRQFFDVDHATDVVSFASCPLPSDGSHRMAEIVVNVERACLEGIKRKSIEREFALYLAHGCDHLAGYDDRTARDRKKMRRRELAWLKEAAELNLLSGLFLPALKRQS